MSLYAELKRRSVFRVAIGYIGVSWLIIQVVETLFSIYGVDESVAQIIVTVLAVGFVPAMILAWVFELTPDGIRRDADANRDAPGMQALGKRMDRGVMIVLALAVGLFAFDKFVLDPSRDAEREQRAEERGRTQALIGSYGTKSIAVMPFANMSPDPDQEYFADGISEELLNLLVRIQDLRVISRTSSFALRNENLSVPELGSRLTAAHILEGSVRKSGNKIRITAQLIEANTDTHLWSQTYDRELDDIFDIQDEIARLVVEALEAELLGDMPTAARTDPIVLTLMMQARRILTSGGENRSERGRALLEEALRIDPEYAPALWQLGLNHYFEAMGTRPFDPEVFEQKLKIINELNDRALAASPDSGLALLTAGWNAFEHEKDFQKAANLVERAIAAVPGDEEVLRGAAAFARRIGSFDNAIRLKRLAAERNPECPMCQNIWNEYRDAKRYDEAIEARLAYSGKGRFSQDRLVESALLKGDAELALEYASGCNIPHACRAMALHSLGRHDEAQAELALQNELPDTEKDLVGTAMATLWLGDAEGALDLLYERYWPHTYHFYQEVLNPVWEPLHDNPRWIALREQSGRTAEAYAAIEFNPVLPAAAAEAALTR
jgi:TolB-like protein/tetratricopeptide (TPR) repeat protein